MNDQIDEDLKDVVDNGEFEVLTYGNINMGIRYKTDHDLTAFLLRWG